MRVVDLISAKRRGQTHTREEIDALIAGAVAGTIPDSQIAAWLMAVCFQGLVPEETTALTLAMADSGERLDLSGLQRVPIDKHSTGGVGDKTSLVVAPIAAAAGLAVPMISGRGLGHTGGTLDKLEAIAGFRTDLDPAEIRSAVETLGVVITGQTAEMAPGDRILYALRDVTATIDSLGLIVSSILSKKVAEGARGLVLDVKTGSGAFMKSRADAEALAVELADTAAALGLPTVALITDMSQPLGRAVGNALEVAEAIDVLQGGGPEDLRRLCLELAGWMIVLGGAGAGMEAARRQAETLLDGGDALRTFALMVENQGGDPAIVENPSRLPQARHRTDVPAARGGTVCAVNAEYVGRAAMLLGAGRASAGDTIQPAAGIAVRARIGDTLQAGDLLAELHYDEESLLQGALECVQSAFQVSAEPAEAPQLVHNVIERRDKAAN